MIKHSMLAAAMALAAVTSSIAAEWPLITLRDTGGLNENPEVAAKLVEIQKRHPGCCDEIWLGESGQRPTVEEYVRHAKLGAALRPLFESAGIAVGFQLCTLGHSPDFGADPAVQSFKSDVWERDAEGNKVGFPCPRAEEVHDYVYRSAKEVMSILKPVSYWLDDDLRLSFYRPEACFCDRCLKAFNEEYRHSFTREQLKERIFGPAHRDPVRAEWTRFAAESLAIYGAAAARAADEVQPDCRVALQTVRADILANGPDYRPVLKALTGTKRKTTGIRPGDGTYTEEHPRDFVKKAFLVTREAERCRNYGELVGTVCYEQETYPRHVMNKSPEAIVIESLLAMASGCDTLSHYWFVCSAPEPLEDFERYCSAVAKARPLFERLSQTAKSTRLAGVARFVGSGAAELRCSWLSDEHDYALMISGVPVTVFEAGLQPWYVNDHTLNELTPEDVAKLEQGRVVFVDKAWERFKKEYPAAKPKNGGKWTQAPEPEQFALTSVRRAWLDALDEVTDGAFPVRVDLNHALRVLPRVDKAGNVVQLCLLNCSIGDTGAFDIVIRSGGKSVTKRIDNLAAWKFLIVD